MLGSGMFSRVADAILPLHCALCESPLVASERGTGLCAYCLAAVPGIGVSRCPRCALRIVPGQPCPCIAASAPAFDAALAGCDYAPPLDRLLLAFKFGAQLGLAMPLAALLPTPPPRTADRRPAAILVPMPLAPGRLAERGFNQSTLLARRLARRSGLTCDVRLLERHGERPAQFRAGKDARLRNQQGAFSLRRSCPDAVILLVDDVMTTGATLHEAAMALKSGGARRVIALVVARTPGAADRVAAHPKR